MLISLAVLTLWTNSFLFVHGVSDDVAVLRGNHFRVYAYEYPPVMVAVKSSENGNVSYYKGFGAAFIYYFADHLQLRLEFVTENPSEVAKKGQWDAGLDAVANKEVDFSPVAFGAVSVKHWYLMDFTSWAIQEMHVLLVPYPEAESRLTAVIRPFNLITWIMIFVSSLAFIGLLSVLPNFNRCLNPTTQVKNTSSFFNIFGKGTMYVFNIFTLHGGNPEQIGITTRSSLRIMLGLWLLMTVVLTNLYMSTLTSYLTVVKLKPIPNSLKELAHFYEHQDECLLTMQKGHVLLQSFYNSNNPSYKKLGDWITEHPKFQATVYAELTNNIVEHHCAHIGTRISSSLRIANDYKTNKKCRMTVSNKPLEFIFPVSFQLPKNSPYTSIINQHLLRAISAGLMEYWKKWNTMSMDMCLLNKRQTEGKIKSIKLVELSSAFFVLGFGIALSALAFVLELLFGSYAAKKRLAENKIRPSSTPK